MGLFKLIFLLLFVLPTFFLSQYNTNTQLNKSLIIIIIIIKTIIYRTKTIYKTKIKK